MAMNPVVHFEMPVDDRERVARFYEKAFGWQAEPLGPINGGFFRRSADKPAQFPSVVIAVDDIRESMRGVADAGGEVLGEPMEIPGVGLYVSFFDTEGNRVAMLQAEPRR